MQHNDFADDLVYWPSLPAILIGVAFWMIGLTAGLMLWMST